MGFQAPPQVSYADKEHARRVDALDALLCTKSVEDIRGPQLREGFAAELAGLELEMDTIRLILETGFIQESGPEDRQAEADLGRVAHLLGQMAFIRRGIHGALES